MTNFLSNILGQQKSVMSVAARDLIVKKLGCDEAINDNELLSALDGHFASHTALQNELQALNAGTQPPKSPSVAQSEIVAQAETIVKQEFAKISTQIKGMLDTAIEQVMAIEKQIADTPPVDDAKIQAILEEAKQAITEEAKAAAQTEINSMRTEIAKFMGKQQIRKQNGEAGIPSAIAGHGQQRTGIVVDLNKID